MKLPYPKIKPNAHAKIIASGEITKNGSHLSEEWEGEVIYNEHHSWVQDEQGKKVESTGKIFIFNDIFPTLAQLTGMVEIRGKKYTFSGSRLYNPDGTVHHVELRLK